MLRWNAILMSIAVTCALVAGCQDQNTNEKVAPEQPARTSVDIPPAPLTPEVPPPTLAATPPEAEVTQASPAPEASESVAPLPKETHAKKSAARASRTYVVRKGDTLQSIAKKYYGDSTKWRRIYDANRQRIKNPDKVSVGMKLIVP